jgi:hypothetical protein
MDQKNKNEELIDKLIKKRKQENDAFQKLLNAMNSKKIEPAVRAKEKKK